MCNIYYDKRIGIYLPNSMPQVKGYSEAGASHTRRALKSFTAQSGSPNEDINWNNYTLRQRGRMLYMSAPIATSAINTNRTKVVGTGLTLKSAINRELLRLSPEAAKEWQKKTEAEFYLWASKKENCDATGMNNFDGMQQLALITWLQSGDSFGLFKHYPITPVNPYALRIHQIEADRIATPTQYANGFSSALTDGRNSDTGNKIFDGVEVDGHGMVVAYHIRNTYPWQITAEVTKWTRVEAYGKKTGLPNVLHVTSSERCEQYRGVTYLAQVIEPLLQLRRYTESELMAALIQSFFTAWIKTSTNPNEIPINEVGAGNVTGMMNANTESDSISESINEYEMAPGTVTHLEKDEDIVFGNPNIPAASFDTFVKTMCRLMGAALEIPYEVLLKEYNSSYSASRAALLEAWEAFKMRRKWLVDKFCQPAYEVWLSEAVARGRIRAPGFFNDPLIRAAWCGTRWIGPVQGQLDPLKEAKAAVILVDHGFKTHEQVTREMGGGDWQENAEQVARENEILIAAGGGRTTITATADDKDEDEDEEGDNK